MGHGEAEPRATGQESVSQKEAQKDSSQEAAAGIGASQRSSQLTPPGKKLSLRERMALRGITSKK